MNKTALKNFATNARKELIEKIKAKAFRIGITEERIKKAQFESSDAIYIDGKQLSTTEKKQREKLISRIKEKGFSSLVEEVAYTYFNRFIALRFMEVNNYLPTKVRVLSSNNPDSSEPDIIKEALSIDLDIDKELVYELKLNNKTEELFKYLVIKQCNSLNKILPFMFETIDDYKEILFPDGLLAKDSFLLEMIDTQVITEVDWEQVEIIGWLYQYYNTEINELVYNGDMSKNKVSKELLPAATQLFTPDWAVQYMVENSLGRLWLEGHSDEKVKEEWKYYLEKDGINEDSRNQNLSPEDIRLFDPCMGSGHILVYAFEVLMTIYESCGYTQRDAAKLILQKNLYGIDIDNRAYQLACFAVIMKARKYNRSIFKEEIELNLCTVIESNELTILELENANIQFNEKDIATVKYLLSVYHNAKEYGSILNVEKRNYDTLSKSLVEANHKEFHDLFQLELLNKMNEIIPGLQKQAQIMTQQYDVVITNPPYLGIGRMSPLLSEYVKKYYPNTKSDLSMVMYQKSLDSYLKPGGFTSFITTTSWMFLKSFQNFRDVMLNTIQFDTLIDFGTELFDGKVGHNPIVAWVNRNSSPQNNMTAIRLVDFCYSKREQKKIEYFNLNNRYYPNQQDYNKIPGSPIAYWASDAVFLMFKNNGTLADVSFPRLGMATAENGLFLRYWHEVEWNHVSINSDCRQKAIESKRRWFPYNKGGEFRKWYGNNDYVVDWENDGERIRSFVDSNGKVRSHNYNLEFIFKPGITWSALSSGSFSSRFCSEGFLFDNAGSSLFTENKNDLYLIQGYLSTNLIKFIIPLMNATLNYQPGTIGSLPFHKAIEPNTRKQIEKIVEENIEISKSEWDYFETSWEFKKHPLLYYKESSSKLETAFNCWFNYTNDQYYRLKSNEEELNRIFIGIYDLQNELVPEVDAKDITIRKADLDRDIKSFISYVVGCSFGRYSLDEEGLIYASGDFESYRYKIFEADKDNILPIVSDAYFEDDIVSRLVEFIKVTFGERTLLENINYIADVLGKKEGESANETMRRYFLNDFFKDHLQTYNKRPNYWLFTSGKQKAFNCLIYMHRYDKSTLSRIRTDYLHELQIRLDAEKKSLLDLINGNGSAKEISNAKKELKSLDLKIEELRAYDEKLHHLADMQIEIDLDDGVSVNYVKFEGLLAPIK
ncbi:BREX-1 system adenine-specific DNA-methyltransferase PglX [Paenibacillus sp. Soil724D2]|uniref:BREX-1 system adenine-specific DNA-methyltransferase PglX n=1 Tax=Paenibacillus sp. (strain Soil724D2) TaxID=1736392 RepID=UPI0007143EB1|nr:BREX-1 system adenine-specific DNA-methyltransferase PglX [Paenibacillus sp. Soil724D2]KRE50662.1 restriction endonuclease [Paenibacillus sp. Soil724D2]